MSPRLAGWVLLVLPALVGTIAPEAADVVEGVVVTDSGPVAGVRVRWQGAATHTTTDRAGRFRLPAAAGRVTASKPGYLIASASAAGPTRLQLTPLPEDNDDYAWVDPHPGASGTNHCGACHRPAYREWADSAHARSARNPRFLQLFARAREQYPLGASVCAACHAPTLRSPTLDYDVRTATGVDASGVHCDYCHKIVAAPTDRLGTRFGRDGLRLLRPPEGSLLSLGPLEDAVRPGESFAELPLYRASRYCASCHEGVVFGVHAYGTYSEWLDSPARRQGLQCQDCHMAPTGTLTNIAPGRGGIERDPRTLSSHAFPGSDATMLRRCLDLRATAQATPHGVRVDVVVRADRVGHRVPTGFPDRHLLLVIEAVDAAEKPAALRDGPRLPASAGKWSGHAGSLYAKQLAGEDGRTPVAFWRPVVRAADTRLAPQQPDRRRFLFGADARHVRVSLWYRRFWDETARTYGWRDNDLLVHSVDIVPE